MNTKEIGEIRRRARRDRSNMTALYGCYVNDNKEIISEFRQSIGIMPENEADKYFALLRRTLSGQLGKNLIDITFKTSQVADSPEHKLLMELRETKLKEENLRMAFYKKVIETVELGCGYLILMGCDSYDVPFKSKDDSIQADASGEVYTYLQCAICPVKQTKPNLHYIPESKEFHDGGMLNIVSAPELGFLFPTFDNRATNIYNALYYTHSPKDSHEAFVASVFNTPIPKPAAEQKKTFEALLTTTLADECSMDVVQTVHEQLCQRIELHKEAKVPEALTVSKDEVKEVLSNCGVSQEHLAKFSVEYDEAFGFEADLHPKNIIGGIKYILINAEENVEVNGVNIHIDEKEPVEV